MTERTHATVAAQLSDDELIALVRRAAHDEDAAREVELLRPFSEREMTQLEGAVRRGLAQPRRTGWAIPVAAMAVAASLLLAVQSTPTQYTATMLSGDVGQRSHAVATSELRPGSQARVSLTPAVSGRLRMRLVGPGLLRDIPAVVVPGADGSTVVTGQIPTSLRITEPAAGTVEVWVDGARAATVEVSWLPSVSLP